MCVSGDEAYSSDNETVCNKGKDKSSIKTRLYFLSMDFGT